MNALLPNDYRVRISTIEYENATKEQLDAICPFCNQPSDVNTIRIIDKFLDPMFNLITNEETERYWRCPLCNEDNKLLTTEFEKKILAEGELLQIVPKPPERKDGLMDRLKYDKEISAWLWNMLAELEGRMSKLREDNWNKGSDNPDWDIDTTGESND